MCNSLQFVKVLVDTHIMNTPGFGAVLFKACEELGVTCVTEQLVIPYSVMWKREVTECSMSSEIQVCNFWVGVGCHLSHRAAGHTLHSYVEERGHRVQYVI